MLSIPYSRYIFYPIPWYSVLIVLGTAIAVILAAREEKRVGLKKDTVIDLALWVLPIGIIGARVYYVVFSWDQFRSDLLSVFRIWEGGIAIYGAVISGFLALLLFCRHRKLSLLLLCDLIAPGLVLAQSIGRWGNYFNMEAYGLSMEKPSLCFFPLAVQIYENGIYVWHMATFFYESLWDLIIFCFLILARRKILFRQGDVFSFYLFLYAAGRFIIEDLRMDSLYTSSSIRVSQLLSAIICLLVFLRYLHLANNNGSSKKFVYVIFTTIALISSAFQIFYALFASTFSKISFMTRFALLSASSVLLILSLFNVCPFISQEVRNAHDEI